MFPVSAEKTVWAMPVLTFLGLLLDVQNQLVCIPADKIERAKDLIAYFVDTDNKKAMILQVQKLSGFLNFLCRCIIPGRVFTRQLYSLLAGAECKDGKFKAYHHIKIKQENRLDLGVWLRFLNSPQVYSRPFTEFEQVSAKDIFMYSDASGKLGFGALCGSSWLYGKWDQGFLDERPSTKYQELYALTAAVLTWIHHFRNKHIWLFCDNISVVHMINTTASGCTNCMVFLRLVVLQGLVYNVRISAKYVSSKDNFLADSLSRLDLRRFRHLGPQMEILATPVPTELDPVQKIWIRGLRSSNTV